jgi:hypothetical protein
MSEDQWDREGRKSQSRLLKPVSSAFVGFYTFLEYRTGALRRLVHSLNQEAPSYRQRRPVPRTMNIRVMELVLTSVSYTRDIMDAGVQGGLKP